MCATKGSAPPEGQRRSLMGRILTFFLAQTVRKPAKWPTARMVLGFLLAVGVKLPTHRR